MKKKIFSLGLALALVFSMSACGSSTTSTTTSAGSSASDSSAQSGGSSNTLYVSAAASMTESLDKVIAAYEKENPDITITPTYDSSGTLKTQIQSGADCDIFISAAQKQMNALDGDSKDCEGTNYVLSGSRVNLLENKCVLIVSPNTKKNITDWDTFQTAIKNAQSSSDLIFCMGNSDVPVGQYTSKILKNLGLTESDMASKGIVTYGSNVKEVVTQVQTGAADCGIVYATDAYSANMKAVAEADTTLTDGPCIYPAAVMQNSKNQEAAQAFLKYLQSDAAMTEFTSVGFTKVTN